MDSTGVIENFNDRNSEIKDELDSRTDDKLCLHETVYIKQEPYDMEDEPGNIQNYVYGIKDDKTPAHETVNSGGYLKQEPCDTKDLVRNDPNYAIIKDEIIEDSTVVLQETGCTTNIKGNYLTCCEECGEAYDLYCLKCPMLIRIFDGNNPDLSDNEVIRTLPKNFVDICEIQSRMGIIAVRVVPKGVVFGPFRRLDSTKDGAVSKWIWENEELMYTKYVKWLNWMQYIRRVDQSSHANLIPFQYGDGLYYQSDYHIGVGEELLVCWDTGIEENRILDSYFKPQIYESLDDAYACTFCCIGYKSICHLAAHNSICPQKRNQDFCKEIVQCAVCKIYVDKKEYSDYHVDQCFQRNRKIFAVHQDDNNDKSFRCTQCPFQAKTNERLKRHIISHSGDTPFVCSICSFKTTTSTTLKRHMVIHSDDKPFGCCICSYKTKTRSCLQQHMLIHTNDKPFACLLCSYKTTTRKRLKVHVATHNDNKPFACSLCSFKARTNSNLKSHLAIHKDDKPFACSFCAFKTKTNSLLKIHILMHNDDKPFACSLCSYKTKTNQQLKRHIATHTDDKPFACSLCPFKARTNSNLKSHIAIHKDEKPFACSLCAFKTKTNWQLKQHIAVHNGDKPYACTVCLYKARTNYKLKLHMAIHSDVSVSRINQEKSLIESKD